MHAPPPDQADGDEREPEVQQQHDRRDRRRPSGFQAEEGGAVHVKRQDLGGASGTAPSERQHQIECIERRNGNQREVQRDHRRDLGQDHKPKPLPRSEPFEVGGLVQLAWNPLETCILQDHAERTPAPRVRHDDGAQRHHTRREEWQRPETEERQPVVRNPRAVLHQEYPPQHTDEHSRHDPGADDGNPRQRCRGRPPPLRGVDEDRDRQSGPELEHDRRNDEGERHRQHPAELRIVQQPRDRAHAVGVVAAVGSSIRECQPKQIESRIGEKERDQPERRSQPERQRPAPAARHDEHDNTHERGGKRRQQLDVIKCLAACPPRAR